MSRELDPLTKIYARAQSPQTWDMHVPNPHKLGIMYFSKIKVDSITTLPGYDTQALCSLFSLSHNYVSLIKYFIMFKFVIH